MSRPMSHAEQMNELIKKRRADAAKQLFLDDLCESKPDGAMYVPETYTYTDAKLTFNDNSAQIVDYAGGTRADNIGDSINLYSSPHDVDSVAEVNDEGTIVFKIKKDSDGFITAAELDGYERFNPNHTIRHEDLEKRKLAEINDARHATHRNMIDDDRIGNSEHKLALAYAEFKSNTKQLPQETLYNALTNRPAAMESLLGCVTQRTKRDD